MYHCDIRIFAVVIINLQIFNSANKALRNWRGREAFGMVIVFRFCLRAI